MPANREPIQKERKKWEEQEKEGRRRRRQKKQQKKCTTNSSGMWRITVVDLIQHFRLTIILQ